MPRAACRCGRRSRRGRARRGSGGEESTSTITDRAASPMRSCCSSACLPPCCAPRLRQTAQRLQPLFDRFPGAADGSLVVAHLVGEVGAEEDGVDLERELLHIDAAVEMTFVL